MKAYTESVFDSYTKGPSGTYWSPNGKIGLAPREGDRWVLMGEDGTPSNHALPRDHAVYIMNLLRDEGASLDSWITRWDYYATAAGVA